MTNYGTGGRMAVVSNNIIRNCHPNPWDPDTSHGTGISVEADAVVTGNIIECSLFGIELGTNEHTRNLIAASNIVRNTTYGIAVSNSEDAGYQMVHGNTIQVYATGGPVPQENGIVACDGAGTVTATNVQTSARILVANNQVLTMGAPESCAPFPDFV